MVNESDIERPTERRTAPGQRRLRADARDNLERLLAAARDVFIEQGAGAPLDDVARRAGVGIATLYRRFPDRAALIRALTLDLWSQGGREARLALDEEPDAMAALVRYMHRALDLRISAVMPALAGQLPLGDAESRRMRDEAVTPVQHIVDAARAEGTLRPEVAFGDVGLMLVRLSHPLPGFPRPLNDALAHRHLDIWIDGLRPGRATTVVGGPAMSLQDLRAVGGREPSSNPHPMVMD